MLEAPAPNLNESSLHARRLRNWCQTSDTRIPDPRSAAALVDRLGIATLFPGSPEVPNLFHAYMGNPEAKIDSGHDSPSGQVYGWRWELGRAGAAFYTSIVRRRPTWVSWALLPAVLRLLAEPRTADELLDLGVISGDAHRIARVLDDAEQPLSTGDLRREAGFPTGKDHRAAYLKAIDELETRLLLAKVFSTQDLDMYHVLVSTRYPEPVERAERMTRAEALDQLLTTYLPPAAYALPARLAKHLGIPEGELRAGLEDLSARGLAREIALASEKTPCYVWKGD
jgi:hypothetical protein